MGDMTGEGRFNFPPVGYIVFLRDRVYTNTSTSKSETHFLATERCYGSFFRIGTLCVTCYNFKNITHLNKVITFVVPFGSGQHHRQCHGAF